MDRMAILAKTAQGKIRKGGLQQPPLLRERVNIYQNNLTSRYCPVSHYSLPNYLQTDLERVQKRALACVFPGKPYAKALSIAGLAVSIRKRHSAITKKLFQLIADNPGNKLHHLLPSKNCQTRYNLRRPRRFTIPLAKTKRFADSFVIQCSNSALYT